MLQMQNVSTPFLASLSIVLFSFLMKQQYLFLQLIMTQEKLSKLSAFIRSISLALIFMSKCSLPEPSVCLRSNILYVPQHENQAHRQTVRSRRFTCSVIYHKCFPAVRRNKKHNYQHKKAGYLTVVRLREILMSFRNI